MSNLNSGQQKAVDTFNGFLQQTAKVAMLISGGAGVGKSYTTATILKGLKVRPNQVIICAPTHKAVGVLKRFMRENQLNYIQAPQQLSQLKQMKSGNPDSFIVGTTSKLLSIRPLQDDEEEIESLADSKGKVKFDKGSYDFLEAVKPKFIFVDEVSMLPRAQFLELVKWCKEVNCRMVMVGDKNQLPPVGSEGIPFDKIRIQYELTENMRALGSAGANIVELGNAIRTGKKGAYKKVYGEGIEHTSDIRTQFMRNVKAPTQVEEEWVVFIGYRNKTVNKMREHACKKVYGHSANEFKAGEIVVSDQRFDISFNNNIDNQAILQVVAVGEVSEVKGLEVQLRCTETGRTFWAHNLSKDDLENPKHPFNMELVSRQQYAKDMEKEKKARDPNEWMPADEDERKSAWREFFIWRDRTVIDIYHPFSLTSHKSQGSTFGKVYLATPELEHFNTRALYVASSRPRHEVVMHTI